MKILDCEFVESTYKSLETILGIKKSDLCQLFESIDVGNEMRESYCNFLFLYIQEKTHCQTYFDKVCWFHATRTWRDNNYDSGLLPTNEAFCQIRKFLLNKTNAPDHLQRRIKLCSPAGQLADTFSMKCANPETHGGPHGCLIRDVLFAHDVCGTVNYFDAPEIVEDFGCKEHYQLHTIPCVVKFVDQWTDTKKWTPQEALSTAFLYVYCDYHNKPLNSYGSELNYSFDGKGLPVLKENILKKDFIEASEI